MPRPKKGDGAKVLQGTFRKDRAIPEQDETISVPPECPTWLTKAAKAHWEKVIKDLTDLGVQLHPVDQDALGTYCQMFVKFRSKPNSVPASHITQMRMIWEKYGMTNGSRSALGLHPKKKKKNRFEQ